MSWKKNNDKSNATLLEEYKKGNMESRDELFNFYKRVAIDISKRYYNLGVDKEDILQSAYEGILMGINKCLKINSQNASALIPYYIRKNIEINILSYYGIYIGIKNNTNIIKKVIDVLKARRDLSSSNIEKISAYLRTDVSEVRKILNIINKTSEEVEEYNIDVERYYIDRETIEEINILLKEYLTTNQFSFIHMRYVLNLTLREIAAKMGISYQRCNQIEGEIKAVIDKIKQFIKAKNENKRSFVLMKIKEVLLLCMKNDNEAIQYLINYYLPKVMPIIKSCTGYNHSEEELIKIAKKEMELSLKMGNTSTYIYKLVKNRIAYSIIFRYGVCFSSNFSFEGQIRVLNMLKAKNDFINEFNHIPSDDELSCYMNCDLELLTDMKKLIKVI